MCSFADSRVIHVCALSNTIIIMNYKTYYCLCRTREKSFFGHLQQVCMVRHELESIILFFSLVTNLS